MAIRSEDLYKPEAVVLQFPASRRRPRTKYLVRRATIGALVVIVGAALMHDGPPGTARRPARPDAAAGSVAPGDTLWDVARRHSPPGADLRAYVDRLAEINGLAGRPLQAGTRLELPK